MTTQVIKTKRGITVGVAETVIQNDVPVSTWTGQPINELSNEELNILWFKLDRYLDTQVLQDIYVEMNMRGIPRIRKDGPDV